MEQNPMNFQDLNRFIVNKMRMSHIYQPVMLMKLLESGGECSETEIARSILTHDQSQIEYYQNVTRNMVGSVLRKHKIIEKNGKHHRVIGSECRFRSAPFRKWSFSISDRQYRECSAMGSSPPMWFLWRSGGRIIVIKVTAVPARFKLNLSY